MSAKNGAYIYKQKMPSGKSWVFVVTTKPEGAALGFFDWYEQIRLLRECEEEKYPYVSDPLKLPREFFEDCWAQPMPPYSELAMKHKIPDRGQETVLEWTPPAGVCDTCGAFSPKACHFLRGVLEAPPPTCVALTRDAQNHLAGK